MATGPEIILYEDDFEGHGYETSKGTSRNITYEFSGDGSAVEIMFYIGTSKGVAQPHCTDKWSNSPYGIWSGKKLMGMPKYTNGLSFKPSDYGVGADSTYVIYAIISYSGRPNAYSEAILELATSEEGGGGDDDTRPAILAYITWKSADTSRYIW